MKTIRVKVKTNARMSLLEQSEEGQVWQALLKAAPINGNANDELITLIAEHFGCRKADVSIKSGGAARWKLIDIDND